MSIQVSYHTDGSCHLAPGSSDLLYLKIYALVLGIENLQGGRNTGPEGAQQRKLH